MRIDVNAFVGSYPYRRVPGTAPEALLAAMDRVGLEEAWITHLPGVFWRNPTEGNAWLIETARRHPRLRPVRNDADVERPQVGRQLVGLSRPGDHDVRSVQE